MNSFPFNKEEIIQNRQLQVLDKERISRFYFNRLKLWKEKPRKLPRNFNLRDSKIFSQAFEAPEHCCTTGIPFSENLGFPKPRFLWSGESVVDQPRSTPLFYCFLKRILWLQTSKAFLRSRKIPMQKLPSFKSVLIKFTTFSRLSSVFFFLWNPNCLGERSLWYSRWFTSFWDTIFSRIFKNELRRAIGL